MWSPLQVDLQCPDSSSDEASGEDFKEETSGVDYLEHLSDVKLVMF